VWVAYNPTNPDPSEVFMDSSEVKMLRYAATNGLKPAAWPFGVTLAEAIKTAAVAAATP
jgi:hypothetical protein